LYPRCQKDLKKKKGHHDHVRCRKDKYNKNNLQIILVIFGLMLKSVIMVSVEQWEQKLIRGELKVSKRLGNRQ
jgi:hypothetical protein